MTATITISSKPLTSKEAAVLLGVSEASVKRWADNGLLRMVKTAGGHRRFRPNDIAMFRRDSLHEVGRPGSRIGSRPQSRVARYVPARNKQVTKDLFKTLVNGRVEETAALLIRLHLEGITTATLADEVLCPAMREVGDMWHQGELSIAEEHVATRTALEALLKLRSSLSPVNHGLRAICCATEGDFHELPVQIGALTLEAAGWDVVNLGTSTPFYALAESIARFSPRLVCVASTLLEDLDRGTREFVEVIRIAKRKGAVIALGGAGFRNVIGRFPAELHAGNFRQLETFSAALAKKRV